MVYQPLITINSISIKWLKLNGTQLRRPKKPSGCFQETLLNKNYISQVHQFSQNVSVGIYLHTLSYQKTITAEEVKQYLYWA